MLIPILLFLLGLILLIKGGDWFVDGATGLAHRFHIPEIIIGATIVSIGTTLPEVMVSATSALRGHGDIAYGNAIGSVICNTALIAAVTIAIRPSKVDRGSFFTPVVFFFISGAFYAANAYITGNFTRITGFILLAVFIVYMTIIMLQAKRASTKGAIPDTPEPETALRADGSVSIRAEDGTSDMDKPLWKSIIFLIVGAALIAIGADLLVDNGTIIAEKLGVPESVIALTFVALGTSLPELVTAISALVKGHSALSLGNIVGANLFNIVLVSGISTVLSPFSIPQGKMVAGINASLVVDIPVMFFVMAFMTIPALIKQKLSRTQGIILLLAYAAFCVFQLLL